MYRKLLTKGLMTVAASIVSSISMILINIIIARTIDHETLGLFLLILSTVNTIVILCSMGMNTTIVKYAAQHYKNNTKKLENIISNSLLIIVTTSSLALIGLVIFNDYFSREIMHIGSTKIYFLYATPALIFLTIDSFFKSYLFGIHEFETAAKSIITGSILNMLIIGAIVFLGGATIIFIGYSFGALAQMVCTTYFLFKNGHINSLKIKKWNKENQGLIWHFSIPAWISGLLVSPAYWVINMLLAQSQHGYEKVAYFGVFMQWFSLIMFIPTNISKIVLPLLSGEFRNNKRELIKSSILINGSIGLIIGLIALLMHEYIFSIYKFKSTDLFIPFTFIILAAIVLSIQTPVSNLIATNDHMWLGVCFNMIWFVTFVGYSYIKIDAGLISVCFGLFLAYTIHTIGIGIYANRTLGQEF